MIRIFKKNENNFTLVGIIFILLFLFLCSRFGSSSMLRTFGLSELNATILFISRILYWISLVFLWLYSVKVEKRNVLIWKDHKYKLLTYAKSILLLFTVLFVGLILIQILYSLTNLNKHSIKLVEIGNILRQNKFLLVFTALTAGVTEEIIFRGYLQPRFEILLKNSYLAILICSILFGLLHYGYGTAINIIVPFFIGLVFAYYYSKYRNIKVLIICHFLWDLLTLFLLLKIRH